MFEKEATEYATIGWDKSQDPRDVFTPRIDETKFNDWRNGAIFGYNKANEWHYVKDGDLPTDRTEEKLVALKSEYGGFFYETDIWCNSLHRFASNNPTKVYAWKEIVIPKESE